MGTLELFCCGIGGSDSTRAVNTIVKELLIYLILSDNGTHVNACLSYNQAKSLQEKLNTTIKEWEKRYAKNQNGVDK